MIVAPGGHRVETHFTDRKPNVGEVELDLDVAPDVPVEADGHISRLLKNGVSHVNVGDWFLDVVFAADTEVDHCFLEDLDLQVKQVGRVDVHFVEFPRLVKLEDEFNGLAGTFPFPTHPSVLYASKKK